MSRPHPRRRVHPTRDITIAAGIHPLPRIPHFPHLEVAREVRRAFEDGEEGAGFVPPPLDVRDGDAGLRLREFPVGEGAPRRNGGAVAVFHVLAEADGEVAVVGGFNARLELDGGEDVDVAHEENRSGGSARAAGFEALDDGVDDHDVLAGAGAEADGFAGPDFLAAEVEAVVGAFAGGDGVVGEAFEEGEGVVDGFGGEDAAVDFGIPLAEPAGGDAFPVDGVVCKARGSGEAGMGGRRWRPGEPGAEAVLGFDDPGWRVVQGVREGLNEVLGPVIVLVITSECTFKDDGETPSVASVEPCQLSRTEDILVPLSVLILLEAFGWRELSRG